MEYNHSTISKLSQLGLIDVLKTGRYSWYDSQSRITVTADSEKLVCERFIEHIIAEKSFRKDRFFILEKCRKDVKLAHSFFEQAGLRHPEDLFIQEITSAFEATKVFADFSKKGTMPVQIPRGNFAGVGNEPL